MEPGILHTRSTGNRPIAAGRWASVARRRTADRAVARGEATMQPDARAGTGEVAARPLAELLACPPAASELLNTSSRHIEFRDGDTVFRQGDACLGLYLVISGDLLRRAERMESRFVLGQVHAGELVELAAALGELRHSYTLTAQSAGSMVMLAFDSLKQAFSAYPPLRMHLLEELAREVSRGYRACCAARMAGIRRRTGVTLAASGN